MKLSWILLAAGVVAGRPAPDETRAMDLSLIYRALAQRQVDLIAGDATSGLIQAYGLAMLQDKHVEMPAKKHDNLPL